MLNDARRIRMVIAGVIGVACAALAASSTAATPTASDEQSLICESTGSARNHCEADVSGGVALRRSTGAGACLLGRTWGYD